MGYQNLFQRKTLFSEERVLIVDGNSYLLFKANLSSFLEIKKTFSLCTASPRNDRNFCKLILQQFYIIYVFSVGSGTGATVRSFHSCNRHHFQGSFMNISLALFCPFCGRCSDLDEHLLAHMDLILSANPDPALLNKILLFLPRFVKNLLPTYFK